MRFKPRNNSAVVNRMRYKTAKNYSNLFGVGSKDNRSENTKSSKRRGYLKTKEVLI